MPSAPAPTSPATAPDRAERPAGRPAFSPDGRLELRPSATGERLVCRVALRRGEVVAPLTGREVPAADRHTIQVGRDLHLTDLGPFAYLDHSCRSTVHVDVAARTVVARVPLRAGSPLTFFYPATEWDMAEPFACRCGAPGCVRRVAGARHLPAEVLAAYELAPHVRELLAEREGDGAAPRSEEPRSPKGYRSPNG